MVDYDASLTLLSSSKCKGRGFGPARRRVPLQREAQVDSPRRPNGRSVHRIDVGVIEAIFAGVPVRTEQPPVDDGTNANDRLCGGLEVLDVSRPPGKVRRLAVWLLREVDEPGVVDMVRPEQSKPLGDAPPQR